MRSAREDVKKKLHFDNRERMQAEDELERLEKETVGRSNSVGNARRREQPQPNVDLLQDEERKKYNEYLKERWSRVDPAKKQKAEKQIGEVTTLRRESARKARQQQK